MSRPVAVPKEPSFPGGDEYPQKHPKIFGLHGITTAIAGQQKKKTVMVHPLSK
jgi:hypothetical protein